MTAWMLISAFPHVCPSCTDTFDTPTWVYLLSIAEPYDNHAVSDISDVTAQLARLVSRQTYTRIAIDGSRDATSLASVPRGHEGVGRRSGPLHDADLEALEELEALQSAEDDDG